MGAAPEEIHTLSHFSQKQKTTGSYFHSLGITAVNITTIEQFHSMSTCSNIQTSDAGHENNVQYMSTTMQRIPNDR